MEAIFRQNNTSTTSKILKSKKPWNSFKTIKDILLIILSKNNGILRIIEAKFDGEKRRNLQHTACRIRKMAQVSKLSVLHIGRFACSVMQNTKVMFKQMRNLTRGKKISEKIKILHFANAVT